MLVALTSSASQVDVFQAFLPVITYETPEKGKSQWKQRLLAGALLGGTFYMLYCNAPDADFMKEEALKAHESLLDYLVSAKTQRRRDFMTMCVDMLCMLAI
jgi:hypothetical protein